MDTFIQTINPRLWRFPLTSRLQRGTELVDPTQQQYIRTAASPVDSPSSSGSEDEGGPLRRLVTLRLTGDVEAETAYRALHAADPTICRCERSIV
eukprot:COSAG02_NODE_1563_length_11913_cov_6.216438_3_plen_95_part_00